MRLTISCCFVFAIACCVVTLTGARPIPSSCCFHQVEDVSCRDIALVVVRYSDRVSNSFHKSWMALKTLAYNACLRANDLYWQMENYFCYFKATGKMWYDRSLSYLESRKDRLRQEIKAVSTAVKTFDYVEMLEAGLTGVFGKFVSICA
ncbi:hypothetical protein RRG08_021308 [Elysia crispata]|uniref:Uncharacterized protein n=1 Tax=Elysia crispata TaxID=231223 RepID=A0AAE1DCH0_9GAST|nr:hypothetical protein RRG08_021308 [Elysia crispata]